MTAQLWNFPVDRAVTLLASPDTATGTGLLKIEPPVPSWPTPPLPQHRAPPFTIAQVCRSPRAMAVTPELSPETGTGTELVADPLLPSCP